MEPKTITPYIYTVATFPKNRAINSIKYLF